MKKLFAMVAMAAVVCFAGCNQYDELKSDIDALASRITALETQVQALNSNVEALEALSAEGATISKVEQGADGSYTITLSNGEVITLQQGSEAEAVIPIIGIDGEGYWVVDYRDGAGFVRILVDGNPIKASANDGVTPLFRISDSGNWQVSYDGGQSYSDVLDTEGKPVNAIGSGEVTDKFFESVTTDGDSLVVRLLTGEEISVPIVPDFFCHIIAAEGVQHFTSAQTQRYEVQIRGVESLFITAPDGWQAQLSDAVEEKATLTVTAPKTSAAVRSLADNTRDVAILAISGNFATIAKIQVEVEGDIVVTPPSIVSLTSVAEKATETTLTFNVEISEDADGVMWLCKSSEESAPEANTIAASGKSTTSSEIVVDGLKEDTQYTLYAIAAKGTVYSEVASAEGRTTKRLDVNDYYVAGVEINGVVYSSQSEGAVVKTLAADATENMVVAPSEGGVIFLEDESDSFDFTQTSSQALTKDLVLIGRYADRKTTYKMEKYSALRNREGKVIFKNLKIDASSITNYVFNCGSATQQGGVSELVFEDCEINYNKILITFYNAAADSYIGDMVFRNCKIRYDGTDNTHTFIISQVDAGLSNFKSMTFENNIFYAKNSTLTASTIFQQSNAANQSSLSGSLENCHIKFNNNTMADFISFGTSTGCSYFAIGKYASLQVKNNIFYSSETTKYPSIVRVYHQYTEWPSWELSATENVCYGTAGWKLFYYGSDWAIYPEGGNKTITKAAESPLTTVDKTNGTFVKAAEYETYGSTLK